jgi:cation transport regulator ChaB
MKRNVWAVSLVALALFSGGAWSQDSATQQAPAVDVAAPQLSEEVLNLVNDKRTAQELSSEDLKKRAKQARRFAKSEDLPPDVRLQLQALADADGAELQARAKAAEQAPVAEQPTQEQVTEQPAGEAPKAAEAPSLPEEVQGLLSDARAVGEFSVEELKARQQTARKFSRDESLPEDVRRQLADIAKQVRQELVKRDPSQQPSRCRSRPRLSSQSSRRPRWQLSSQLPNSPQQLLPTRLRCSSLMVIRATRRSRPGRRCCWTME